MLQINAAELVIGAAAGKGEKHHYIPSLYTCAWAGPDGRLCEYARPYQEVKPQWKHPDATGYVRGLYTVPQNDPTVSEYIERKFLKVTDDQAAKVLQRMRAGEHIDWDSKSRSAWSRFVISLMLRNPEYVARMAAEVLGFFDPNNEEAEKRYREIRGQDDPETYAAHIARLEFHPAGRASAIAMQEVIDSPLMGGRLNQMRWAIVTFNNERFPLLTSDRPIIMTNGLVKPTDHLSIPIGPRMLFVATNNEETENMIRNMNPIALMKQVNDRVASQARRYIYSCDNKQLRFVENRLGRKWPSTPLETSAPV
ncbi:MULTISPECIES: DUF4238 domain-containing protein [unclassified Bradyrhizobium]|uniref:DUF4238 domain-containing protein n=1 Tax=unclassified Bradyrhizobium TaxID=2631580 RepID=UPI002FEF5976